MNDDLAQFLSHGWDRLTRGVADRRAASRHPVLATTSPDGWPEARTVVLRAANRAEGTVEAHTDTLSAKAASLRANPRAELHIWDERARLQIRLRCSVTVLTHPETADRWARVPEAARRTYGTTPPPGTPIAEAAAFETPGTAERFAALLCRAEQIDLLHLDTTHRRAVFTRADGWTGTWVAP